MPVLRVDLHLPVPSLQVDLGEVLSPPKSIQAVIALGARVLVIPTDGIQPQIVHTEPPGAIRLGSQDHRGCILTVALVHQPILLQVLSGLQDGGSCPRGHQ